MIEFPIKVENRIISELDFNTFCSHIIANSPEDIKVLATSFYNIGNDNLRQKNYEIAIKLYEKSLEYIDYNSSVYKNMASCYKYLGEFEISEFLYKKIIEIDPDCVDIYLQLSLLCALKNNKHDSILYLKLYEKYYPDALDRIKFLLQSEISDNDVSLGGEELIKIIDFLIS